MRIRREKLLEVFTCSALGTATLGLRLATNRDALEMSRLYNADGGDFQTYMHGTPEDKHTPFGPSLVKHAMRLVVSRDEQDEAVSLFVVRKQKGHPFIGSIRVSQDDLGHLRIVPYLIPSERGHGVLKELYEKVIGRGYAAGLFPEHKVFAQVSIDNDQGRRFLISHEFAASGAAEPLEIAGEPQFGQMVIPFERELVLSHKLG